MQNIFLIGFMGCGKSTVATCLANKIGMICVEMDHSIETQEGMSIPKIFESYGENYFRNAETMLLKEIQTRDNQVVSCGGGVVLREDNVIEMRKKGTIVLLVASAKTTFERVKDYENRPLLTGKKTISDIETMMEVRRPIYEAIADMIVHTDDKCVQDICEEIIKNLKED